MIFKNYTYLGAIFLFLGIFIQNASASPCDSFREAYDDAANALSEAQTAEENAQEAYDRAVFDRTWNDFVEGGDKRGTPSDEVLDELYTDWIAASNALEDAEEQYSTASDNYSRCLTLNRHVCGCPSTVQNVTSCSCSWQSYRYGVNCPCYDS
jgi:hypothetical protein